MSLTPLFRQLQNTKQPMNSQSFQHMLSSTMQGADNVPVPSVFTCTVNIRTSIMDYSRGDCFELCVLSNHKDV